MSQVNTQMGKGRGDHRKSMGTSGKRQEEQCVTICADHGRGTVWEFSVAAQCVSKCGKSAAWKHLAVGG